MKLRFTNIKHWKSADKGMKCRRPFLMVVPGLHLIVVHAGVDMGFINSGILLVKNILRKMEHIFLKINFRFLRKFFILYFLNLMIIFNIRFSSSYLSVHNFIIEKCIINLFSMGYNNINYYVHKDNENIPTVINHWY